MMHKRTVGWIALLGLVTMGWHPQWAGAQSQSTTAALVLLAGHQPGLGAFGGQSRLDLTTSVQTILGPMVGPGFTTPWDQWRPVDGALLEGAVTTGSAQGAGTGRPVVVIFGGGRETDNPTGLRQSISEAKGANASVFVIPSQPELRIADLFKLRQEAVTAGAEFVDLGSVAGGRPFEEALDNVARIHLQGPAKLSSASSAAATPSPSSLAADGPLPGAVAVSQPTQSARAPQSRPSGPVSAEVNGQERIIYMAPPPGVPNFQRTRPVQRDPSLKKVPALAN